MKILDSMLALVACNLWRKNIGNDARKKWKSSKPQILIYASQFLSSWGDRMWLFAGGLFLIEITPESFRLVAIYEAALALTVIVFGAIVGRWIDRSPRLIAAQISLFVQNLMVCFATAVLCFLISYKEFFDTSLNGWARTVAEAAVIIMACIAQIGTLGIKLAIEKDWIVVICDKDDAKLSRMNGVLRSIDLSTEMLAPVLVGFVMSGWGMIPGGILIAVWNVSSFVVEYATLHYLYQSFPSLRRDKMLAEQNSEDTKKEKLLQRLRKGAVVWKNYFSHKILFAGMALAVLFMTVLSLDNYSRAYVYNAGVGKGTLGILTAFASLSGIVGSIAYPILRKKTGVLRTGLIGFGSESVFLILCVASIFTPGSQFVPSALWRPSLLGQNSTVDAGPVANLTIAFDPSFDNATAYFVSTTIDSVFVEDNSFYNGSADVSGNGNVSTSTQAMSPSVSLLLAGIILSRFGLWLADLSVTQILQEEVHESERGAINGVQYALNQIFNLLRNVLLIILPAIETFGYLVILSYIFVMIGFFLFLFYARKNSKCSVYEVEAIQGQENKSMEVPL